MASSDPKTRLGRAAIFAFRASAVLALSTTSACGDDRADPPPSVLPPDTSLAAPYGAPPTPVPPEPPPSTVSPLDDPGASDRAMYGGPITPEAEQILEGAPEAPAETTSGR